MRRESQKWMYAANVCCVGVVGVDLPLVPRLSKCGCLSYRAHMRGILPTTEGRAQADQYRKLCVLLLDALCRVECIKTCL